MVLLETKGITKNFDGLVAVDNVDLEINQGEITSIIGPNGAGKTTLFNLVTGGLRCTRGKVIFKGKDITNYSSAKICREGIGRSFQIVSIFPKSTVFENVRMGVASYHGRNWDLFSQADDLDREETLEILEEVGLIAYADTISGYLPHGDQKRLDIAMALVGRPEVLLLDEPTAGLNPRESTKIMDWVCQIGRSRGMTILFIEHDMSVVFSCSEKVRVMHQGKLIAEGKPDEIKVNDEVKRIYLGT
jgi:branched-chain amino acid transport system ATP-binding protein